MLSRSHLSFANVASATALVVALTGSGVAVAAGLAPDSVRSATIANGQVKNPDLAANAVTGAKVAPDSLTGADVKESTLALPAGSRVDAGADGAQLALTEGFEEYATVTALAPANGFLLVTAEAQFGAGQTGTGINMSVYDGDTMLGEGLWSPGVAPAAPGVYTRQSQTITVRVTKGVHPLSLRFAEYTNGATLETPTQVAQPHLTAVFLPAGTAGVTPTGR
jgi:hypothetical protein